jgi:type II secretory ATPase GspE/PulE/Tfp pilus assembly ATPase PilB-like protein
VYSSDPARLLLRRLIQHRAPASELRAAAMENGMRTLRQDGLEKCPLGVTDFTEVRAVT